MGDPFNIRPVEPIGKRQIFGHVHTTEGCYWGPLEIDDHPDSPEGRDLRKRRVAAGIGVRDAARALGLTAVQLSDLERGRATCDWAVLFKALGELDGGRRA